MELEALRDIHSQVTALGAQIVVLTPEAGTLHSRPAQEAEFDLQHSVRPAPEGGGAVSACVHASGLLARPVQIIWDRTRQVP